MFAKSSSTVLVILLGAESFPNIPNFKSSKAFTNSRNKVKEYFLDSRAFRLPNSNMLDLFDCSDSATTMMNRLEDWLEQKIKAQDQNNQITDLIVYYVGHGGFKGGSNEYYLAIRSSRERRPYFTSLPTESLLEVIQKNTPRIRKYFILDACFAGSALQNVQGFDESPKKKIEQANSSIVDLEEKLLEDELLEEELPKWGISFLCAASKKDVAVFKEDYTIFSEALIHTLVERPNLPFKLTLLDLKKYAKEFIQNKYPEEAEGLPEVHSPEQRGGGDIAEICIFPRRIEQDKLAKRILWCLDGKVMVLIEKEEESFYIDECPVSSDQFKIVFEESRPKSLTNLKDARSQDNGYPKVSVTAQSAIEYGRKSGKCLPTAEQWCYLIQLDEERYESNGKYKKLNSTANLMGKGVSVVRKYEPQHKEQIWDLVGNTFEVLQDSVDSQRFYKVSSFHTSSQLEAFHISPTYQVISPATLHPTLGFRTVVLTKELLCLDSTSQDTFIPLEEG